MFCPQCGSSQSEELKFCKSCGANLQAVQQALTTRDAGGKIDWSKTWVAEMFLSEGERKRREGELERQRGITPEIKRYNEIKGGVITGSIGLALAIFLAIFMQGIILSGNVSHDTAEILSRIWVVGVLPLFVGLALIFNGVVVSKKLVELSRREPRSTEPNIKGRDAEPHALRAADTSEFIPAGFSVTEGTTQHLGSPLPKQQAPDNN